MSCQHWGRASSGPVPWAPAAQHWQAGHCRQDTSQHSHLVHCSTRHLTPHHHLSPQVPPCWLSSGLCSLPALGPAGRSSTESTLPSHWGRRAGPQLLCSLSPSSPRMAWCPALPASLVLKNLPWQGGAGPAHPSATIPTYPSLTCKTRTRSLEAQLLRKPEPIRTQGWEEHSAHPPLGCCWIPKAHAHTHDDGT